MSQCEEYRTQIIQTKEKIRRLNGKRPPIIVTYEQRFEDQRIRDKIELLEQKLEVLNDKYERCLSGGGC